MSYNGWSNYETWNAVLWLLNDEKAYADLYDQLVFAVTMQHGAKALGYARAFEAVARRFYGEKTPDDVVLTPAKTKINWEEAVASMQDSIDKLESLWLEELHQTAAGKVTATMDAKDAFRKKHRYNRWWEAKKA